VAIAGSVCKVKAVLRSRVDDDWWLLGVAVVCWQTDWRDRPASSRAITHFGGVACSVFSPVPRRSANLEPAFLTSEPAMDRGERVHSSRVKTANATRMTLAVTA